MSCHHYPRSRAQALQRVGLTLSSGWEKQKPSHGAWRMPWWTQAWALEARCFPPTCTLEARPPHLQEAEPGGFNNVKATIQSLQQNQGKIERFHCRVRTWLLKISKKMARLYCMFKYKFHPKPGKYFSSSKFRLHNQKQTLVKPRAPLQSSSSHYLAFVCHTVIILLIQVES